MNRQTLKRLAVKGTITYVAVFSLVLMVAMPAMALIAARNSVNSRSIINGQVKYRDIANKAVRTSKLANKAVRRGKIANGAVRSNHIKDGAVWSRDIHDGQVSSADIGDGSITNTDISSGAGIADSKISYSTKTGYLSIPAAAFSPNSDNTDYSRDHSIRLMGGVGSFRAPVYLPQGAKVTRLRYSLKDNTAGYTQVMLSRVKHFNNAVNDMAGTSASSNSAAWQVSPTTSISYANIDNSTYAYSVNIWLSAANIDLRAGNIVIDYTYFSPGS